MSEQPTCGELFRSLAASVLNHPLLDAAPDCAFGTYAIGFFSGQAEKVYSGACPAFLARPSEDWWGWSIEAMRFICAHYGLIVLVDAEHREIWGVRDEKWLEELVLLVKWGAKNSPAWHAERAYLCGISPEDVDYHYHERTTFGLRCEPLPEGGA